MCDQGAANYLVSLQSSVCRTASFVLSFTVQGIFQHEIKGWIHIFLIATFVKDLPFMGHLHHTKSLSLLPVVTGHGALSGQIELVSAACIPSPHPARRWTEQVNVRIKEIYDKTGEQKNVAKDE